MKKVLLIANTDWYLFNFRLSLAQFLKTKGYEVVMVSPSGPYVDEFKRVGFRWIEWELDRQISWPWMELNALRRLSRIYRDEAPDLIHLHTMKALIYGGLASPRADHPRLILSVAGRGHAYSSRNPLFFLFRQILNSLIKFIDVTRKPIWIFENSTDLEYFTARKLIVKGKFFLIESVGLNLNKYPVLPEPGGIPTVLYAGRMLRSKGVGVLVGAVRILKKEGLNFNCILVGSPDKGSLDSIDEMSLKGWEDEGLVKCLGWQNDMAKWYQLANLVVFPTAYGEGVPTVLLEAAASGRAIVATNHPGCAAVVKAGKTGLLVSKNDRKALANAISRLLTDPGLRGRMGKAGRELIENQFTSKAINRATLSAYGED